LRWEGKFAVEWCFLGPLRVADDAGTEIPIPAGRVRVLLAALLTRANRVVSIDELGEALWDGTPPPGAARTIRVYVVRLRSALGPVAAGRIITQAPGYLCVAGADEVDALRFEELRRRGRAAAREHAWAQTAELLSAALGLWRGLPLADVPSDLLRSRELPRLEQLHLQVIEEHLDAEMHLGRHEHLIPRLSELTVSFPLHEHLHAQLMRVLARAGRRAEALSAYQHVSQVLHDELGIEPGAELRDLQQRILAGESELPAAVAAPRPASAVVPRQLPAATPHFTGRQTELDALTSLLTQADATRGRVVVAAIDGMAGIGKTALALDAAHRLAGEYPDGQLFIDLHGHTKGQGPRTPGDALAWFLRSLGVLPQQVPQDEEERAALYRQQLHGTRTLIVLDNAADEAQVRPLLPASPGCRVLITSRRRLKGLDDAHTLTLDGLPPAAAIALLRTVAGPERIPLRDPALAEIAALCGYLPLALRIAAALVRHHPAWQLGHLAGLLSDRPQRISVLADGERDLGAVFDLSYLNLSSGQQNLLRLLALIPGSDADRYAAAALTATDPATAAGLLEDLVDHNLLIQHVAGRYQFHDLIRAYASDLVADGGDGDAAHGRLLDYYRHAAGQADALISRFPRPVSGSTASAPALNGPEDAWAWLRTERPNLLAALHHATATGRHDYALALTAGLATLLRTDGLWAQSTALHAAAAATARRLGRPLDQAHALLNLADERLFGGDFASADRDLQEALRLCRDLSDRSGQARALIRLAAVRRLTGDHAEAVGFLQEALGLVRDLGDQLGQANALTQLGDVRGVTGDPEGAIRDLQKALDLYRDLADQYGQAKTTTLLAERRRAAGDFSGAARDLRSGLELFRSLGDRQGQANALTLLGDVRGLTGEQPDAIRDLYEAIELFRALADPVGEGIALTFLGRVRTSTGDFPGALRDLREALNLHRQTGARSNLAWALNYYAAVFIAAGDHARALSSYLEALQLAREVRQPDDEALATEGIGECHLQLGDQETGLAYLDQALSIFKRLGMRPDIDRVLTRLAQPPVTTGSSPAT
jgi:DNA-binding SARP family transcriptional activator/tetratricopeptide (TPR) repeat protein